MRIETVSLDLLLPIEPVLRFEKNIANMFNHFDQKIFRAIPVIEYPVAGDQRFIMGDGHHRAAYCYLTQQPAVIEVLESDREVFGKVVGAFSYFERIEDFVNCYFTGFKIDCEKNNIYSIEHLVRKKAETEPHGIIAEKLQLLDQA